MFDNTAPDVFSNIPDSFRPDRGESPAQLPAPREAPTPAAQGMSGHQPSPDGLGAYAEDLPEGLPAPYPQYVSPDGGVPMGQWNAPFEPSDVSPEGAIRSAGMTTLAATMAFGAGLAVGGWKAGVAGLLLTGGAFNMYRAQKWWGSADASEKHEAVVSSVMGAAGIAAGGYAAYKAYSEREAGE